MADAAGGHVDVAVLGAGPGGYVAAIRAAQLGKTVAIVEEKYWGGVCLNVGCIPSKALLRNAELAHIFTKEAATFGISGDVTFDYGVAFARSRKVADGRAKGVRFLMKKNKIREFDARGTFTGPHSMSVDRPDGRSTELTFDHAIIATGAKARLLPGTARSERVVTYEEQILSGELPASIIIAGAGAIGVEFAYVLHNYGVKVTIVEFLDRIVPLEDERGQRGTGPTLRADGHRGADRRARRADRGGRRRCRRHVFPGRRQRDPAGRQGAAGDRLRPEHHRLRPRDDGRDHDRPRRDRR